MGIGYDPSTYDYLLEVWLQCSLRTSSWKQIEDFPGGVFKTIHERRYELMEFSQMDCIFLQDSPDKCKIVSFDVANERSCARVGLPGENTPMHVSR